MTEERIVHEDGNADHFVSYGAQESNPLAQDAINRMARAHRRGTGCHLSAEMIKSLSNTRLGELWSQEDPRDGRFYGPVSVK